MDFDYLETLGKFIGTYGLAVFLVLYYAIKLYPEIQKERAEWIRQITRLRQLVDPATRPLTKDQARTVLQLAGDALADRLRLVLDSGGRFSVGASAPVWPGDQKVIASVFGQRISFDPEAALSQDARDKEFDGLLSEIGRALKDQARRYRDNLEEALKHASDMARKDAYRLALLRFSNTSLETVWTKAYEEAAQELSKGVANTLAPAQRYEVEESRRFLLKHPSAPSHRDALEAPFAEIRFYSGQEHANYLKTVFDRQVDHELREIDGAEQDV